MKIKISGKKIRRRICAMALAASIVLTSFSANGQVVFAKTDNEVSVAEQEISEENLEEESLDGNALLVEDEDTTGVYYNANSDMRDFRDETIYFVMTTRFYDGDPSNNVQCWDGQNQNSEEDPPWRGDFKGLIEKLDYIKALGFTAIWITPVVKNASGYDYHGYHAINFMEVDSRYESDGCDYQDLIDAVHARGMKIIQDVVFNHTGNWGEENLYPMFTKDESGDLSDVSCMQRNMEMAWAPDYDTFTPTSDMSLGAYQLRDRLKLMNADSDEGIKYDVNDIYHHNGFVGSSFEQPIVQYGSIHYADCMDLNTENPIVYKYLVDAYSQYIRMGVDAFRVDTVKHISRLTLNNAFNQQLNDVYNEVHGTTGEGNFYMFGEVCTRWRGVWNSNIPAISTPFYTWKETKEYAWDDSETAAAVETNCASARQHYTDNSSNVDAQPTSTNAFLNGNEYHTPDYSQASGMNVIDFPMHWAFASASEAYQQALQEDPYYNDSTFNVTYVDSHDYAPDNAPENVRYNKSTETWAENLSLIFTFRGIPCIYYGSEVEFMKGAIIDKGPEIPLAESGRAYFGDYIEGSVNVVDFGRYTNATGAMAKTLNNKLSLHIQRLNRLRAAIPALRKGQYSTEGCNGSFAYKRRYTDDTTDSFALIALTSDATFTGIPNGKYTDAITGDVQNVTNGTLSTSGIMGQGDLRVYVLDTEKTKAPGMIDGYSEFMSGGCDLIVDIVDPTGIVLDKTSAGLDLGETVTLTATVSPENATNKTVSWNSSNPSVATVSGGKVTAKGEGTATITASDSKGHTATAAITVKATGVVVESVTLNKTSATLDAGQTVQLSATIAPADADSRYAVLTWSSSDAKIATVSQNGLVTAVKKGTATITAETASGKSASMQVTVTGTVIYGNAIHFEKPSDWGNNIKVYMWEGDGTWKNAAWPGVAMEETDTGVYSLEWPEGMEGASLKVIFNDGTNQTADLDAQLNGYYDKNGFVKTVPPVDRPIETTIDISLADSTVQYTYNGQAQKPAVVVKANDTVLTENTDYTVTYQNNVNACDKSAGTNAPTIVISGKGNYADKIDNTLTFTIQPKALSTENVTFNPGENTYTGAEIKPEVKVSDTSATITKNDYSVLYSNNINAGTATVDVTGTGNYTGKVSLTFVINKAELPKNAPEDRNITADTKLSEIPLSDGWSWSDDDKDKVAASGETISVTAVYNGADKANYETLSVTLKVTGTDCKHEGEKEIRDAVEATCTEDGNTGDTYCKECGSLLSSGEVIQKTGHSFGEWVVEIEPTETTDGKNTRTCTKCGETETIVVPKKTHEHTWDEGTVTKEPTATEEGLIIYHCTGCTETMEVSIPRLSECEHEWDEGVVTTEATVKQPGVKTYTCNKCNATKTESIPVLQCNHTWNEGVVTIEATETENGKKEYTCTICGATKIEILPRICNHVWDEGVVTIEPTETEDGVKIYTCTKCNQTRTESIPATGTSSESGTNPDSGTDPGTTTPDPGSNPGTTTPDPGSNPGTTTPDPGSNPGTTTPDPGTDPGTTTPDPGSNPGTTPDSGTVVVIDTKSSSVEVGDTVKDNETASTYRVTSASSNAKTVEWMITSSKDEEIKVPDEVVINNAEYKVTSVADNAFKNKQTVKKVEIGENVKSIGNSAFSGCTNLEEVSLDANLTTIGAKAFYKCTDLTTIKVPSKVTTIGKSAFYGCKNLKTVVLGTNVKTINDKAFYKCTNLTTITIPSKVSTIGKQTFYGCTKLKTITIKTTKLTDKKVGSNAFKGISTKATIKVPKTKLSVYKNLLKKKGIGSKVTIKK